MNEDIFLKEYVFWGKHSNQIEELKNEKLFNRYLDIYLVAPIIGFIYKRRSEKDKSEENKKIFTDTLMKEYETIKYNYQLIMLLDQEYETDPQNRINKAFKYIGLEQGMNDFEHFNSYVRGGIEILYEKIIEKSPTKEDYIEKFYEFIDEFQAIYNEIDEKDLTEIFKKF